MLVIDEVRGPCFLCATVEADAAWTCEVPTTKNMRNDLLSEWRPYLLIEFHMPDEDRAISNVLHEFDYCRYRLNDRKMGSEHPHDTS